MSQNGHATPVQERAATQNATEGVAPTRVEGVEVPAELLLDLANIALQTDPGRALWRGFTKYGLKSESLRLVINSIDVVAAEPPPGQ